jgi:Protein of unknown function (DUF3048) N-terminal domain/Protein of unknown function (DUF3048) C-terminal domain
MQFSRLIVFAVLVATVLAGCGSEQPSPPASLTSAPSGTPAPTQDPTIAPTETPTVTPTPEPTAPPGIAALDGRAVDPSVGQRLPVAVMVDDNAVARPQYGFNAASIVYQAPADGGEDRYMMVFQELDAKRIEPVRSGRPYFVIWASEYRSAFAHYGGDAKTLALLPGIDGRVLYDVDALFGSGSAFHRDKARTSPHNAYTSSDAIRAMAVKHGAPAAIPGEVGIRRFADDLPADQRPAKGSITIPYGRGTTGYSYDARTNAYLRSVAGKPQTDAADGKRVTARNVIVLFMGLSIDPESEPGHARPVLAQIGSGKALVFRDGHVIQGTWRKDTAAGLTRFFDAAETEITLVRGRLFIQVVPTGTKVTYVASE